MMGVGLVVFSQIDLECIFKKDLCVPLKESGGLIPQAPVVLPLSPLTLNGQVPRRGNHNRLAVLSDSSN